MLQGIHCTLDGVKPSNGKSEWSDIIMQNFCQIVPSSESSEIIYSAVTVRKDGHTHFVKLADNEGTIYPNLHYIFIGYMFEI